MSKIDVNEVCKAYPNKDPAIIRALVEECRDLAELIDRLDKDDASTQWKSYGKKQDQNQKRQNRGPRKNLNTDNSNNKSNNQQNKVTNNKNTANNNNNKTKIRKIVHKVHTEEFGVGTSTTWDQLNPFLIDDPNNTESTDANAASVPEQKEVSNTNPDIKDIAKPQIQNNTYKTENQQNLQPETTQNNEIKIATAAAPALITPQIQQPPAQTQSLPSQNQPSPPTLQLQQQQKKQGLVLLLPSSLANIKPDTSKFGIFSGPINRPQEAPVVEKMPEFVISEPVKNVEPPAPVKLSISSGESCFEVPLQKIEEHPQPSQQHQPPPVQKPAPQQTQTPQHPNIQPMPEESRENDRYHNPNMFPPGFPPAPPNMYPNQYFYPTSQVEGNHPMPPMYYNGQGYQGVYTPPYQPPFPMYAHYPQPPNRAQSNEDNRINNNRQSPYLPHDERGQHIPQYYTNYEQQAQHYQPPNNYRPNNTYQ